MMGDSSSTNHRPVITELAAQTDDPYLLYVGSGGKDGVEPPYTSTLYPVQGSAILRSGWEQNDLYMHINTATGSHEHPDELSVIAYAYGRPLIVDPGTYTYSHDDISNWLRKTTQAHNTIEINGVAQDSSLGGELERLVQNPEFDFLTGETLGTPGFVHERNVLFVKPGFWIVSDQVSGGTGINSYEQNWHYLPHANVTIEEETNRSYTSFGDNGPDIQVIPADPEELKARLSDGYYSDRFYSVQDAKYTSYLKQTEGEVTFDTVLFPTAHGEKTKVHVERIELDADNEQATALKLEKKPVPKRKQDIII